MMLKEKQVSGPEFGFQEAEDEVFRVAMENQDFDDMNSEHIGKRKTIHSMSAMSANNRNTR